MQNLLQKYQSHFPDIPSLYPYQEEVLQKLQLHRNTLAVIPTGGGKSLLYQLMALELSGVTIVISPLLALMKEQVDELNNVRQIKALAFNSSIPFDEQRKLLRNLKADTYKLIYVSPERLQNPFFRSSLMASGISVSMLVVDEAHCISQWGGSFRPDYGQIKMFIQFLNQHKQSPQVLALTATLSQTAKEDILSAFHIAPENSIQHDVIRQNLKLNVRQVNKEEDKARLLRNFLEQYAPTKTIAYLYSKRECENYADEFSDTYRTGYYHAALDPDGKDEAYLQFVKGDVELLFATTAFGMGINIPDIESVVHVHIPNSIEEYYQQVGRGWRKKNPMKDCNCLALWSETNFDRRKREIAREKYDTDYLSEAFLALTGSRTVSPGLVLNKDKDALLNSDYNLQLLRYKLEEHGIIKTLGEINGTPLTTKMHQNTSLWNQMIAAAEAEMDGFRCVSKATGISIPGIIEHLFEEDLKGNIKKLPATKRDVYFEILTPEPVGETGAKIIEEINAHIDLRIKQLDELYALFTSANMDEIIRETLN